jgi:oxepin-CoA hydrolase/3-oxo-5,6-dehydrosuberyl-CoA semialdehyde dehydrogenase
VTPDDEEFDLFVKERGARDDHEGRAEMHRDPPCHRAAQHLDAVAERIAARLAKVAVGDPSVDGVKMGALASHAQQADVAERVAPAAPGCGSGVRGGEGFAPVGEGNRRRRLLPAHAAAGAQPAGQHLGARRGSLRPPSAR